MFIKVFGFIYFVVIIFDDLDCWLNILHKLPTNEGFKSDFFSSRIFAF